MALLAASGPALGDDQGTFAEAHGCTTLHRSSVAYRAIRRLVRNTNPTVDKQHVHRWATCLETRAKAHRAHELARAFWAWRKRHKAEIEANRMWVYYRSHPMPYCTWGPESGGSYTARNPSSTAGGKYQILDSTWYANGGGRYYDSHPAAAAPPLEQERVARNVLASQGLGAWVNC